MDLETVWATGPCIMEVHWVQVLLEIGKKKKIGPYNWLNKDSGEVIQEENEKSKKDKIVNLKKVFELFIKFPT